MQDQISVKTARKFSSMFFKRLAEHGIVDVAVNEVRGALMTSGRFDAAAPVLLMSQVDGRLFQR